MTSTPGTPSLTQQDYRRLVARTIARYWAPLLPPEVVADKDGLADDMDYGQADHILAALLGAGITLPGLEPEAFADLRADRETPPDERERPAADDPLYSVSFLFPRSKLERLKALALDDDEVSTWQALIRRSVTERITDLEQAAGKPKLHRKC